MLSLTDCLRKSKQPKANSQKTKNMTYTGRVMKSTGSWYEVLHNENTTKCKVRGNFRTKGKVYTNPVAVGDYVDFIIKKEENTGLIVKVHERKNYIVRKSINLRHRAHIIASNIDLALLIITVAQPQTHTVFIDRFLVSAKAYNIPVQLVFNKIDLYNEDEMLQLEELENIYKKINYPTIRVSALKGTNIEELKLILKDKNSVILGNSGVGKSSLINAIDETLSLKTADISHFHHKGRHTTTFAEIFKIKSGGFITDTPGIKGFGLVNLEDENLATYFSEMLLLQGECKYYNCTHTHEPDCRVIEAVKAGEISESRYKSYISMLLEDTQSKYR